MARLFHEVGVLFGPAALLAIPIGADTLLVACTAIAARLRRT